MKGRIKIALGGIGFALAAAFQLAYLVSCNDRLFRETKHIIIAGGIFLSVTASVTAFHIATLIGSRHAPIHVILIKYAFPWIRRRAQRMHWRTFEEATKDCARAQEILLLQVVQEHKSTVYGQDAGFKSVTSVDDFRRHQPLSTYNHYVDYIERTANGEVGVMLGEKPTMLGKTSGTTGASKRFPVSAQTMKLFSGSASSVSEELRVRFVESYKPLQPLQMMCCLLTGSTIGKSNAGIPIGPITSILFPDAIYKILFSTPVEGSKISHEPTAMYVHALFALRDEHLGGIMAPFLSSVYIYFRFMEVTWQSLAEDIRRGSISEDDRLLLTIAERKKLNGYLYPMPERADDIESQFRLGFEGVVGRLWPDMTAISSVTSGAMQPFVSRTKMYTGNIPLLSSFYVSTEGLLGIACRFPDDGRTEYVCFPNNIFYEFIPSHLCDEDNPKTCLVQEVTAGECYELVVTNNDGLYRYRMGDVVTITGFYNQAPIFAFQYRKGEIMNLRSEKTSEVHITTALNKTIQSREGARLVNYACADSTLLEDATGNEQHQLSPYYVIFLEISTSEACELMDQAYIDKFQSEFEANLRETADYYNRYRQSDVLSPLQTFILDASAFDDLRAHILRTSSGSAGQFKMPKKLRKVEWVRILLTHKLIHKE